MMSLKDHADESKNPTEKRPNGFRLELTRKFCTLRKLSPKQEDGGNKSLIKENVLRALDEVWGGRSREFK